MKDVHRKVRRSQTVMPFGVGGILDLRGESFVAADIRTWGGHGSPVHSPRLAARLNVAGFRAAPVIPSGKAEYVSRVGPVYARFPNWLFCPQCRRMYVWGPGNEQRDKTPTCGRCTRNPQLAPMRFVQICRDGHLSDIDWRWWAHSRADTPDQRQCAVKTLAFDLSERSAGLDSLSVRCITCKASRPLSGIDTKDALKRANIRCSGKQPWQCRDEAVECAETPQAVQRGASNVYFPSVHSALDIPSTGTHAALDERTQAVHDNHLWMSLSSAEGQPLEALYIQVIAQEAGVSEQFVRELLRRHQQEIAGQVVTTEGQEDLSEAEWRAFTDPRAQAESTAAFTVRDVGLGAGDDDPLSRRLIGDRVANVIVADRLREVRALEGFWRYEPGTRERLISVNPVAKRPQWLPAFESYGEGVFLAFDEQRLLDWEALPAVAEWAASMDADVETTFQRDRLRERTGPALRPRYVMLHTLAHLFIRQLSFDSGYNAASLRERIYAKSPEPDRTRPLQAGILIYTAAGDAEGTLGGLVRQGEPPNLIETMVRMLESAQWCSNDPLCADPTGRGFANVNRAACHACCLLPETSCETGNALLDRTLITGEGAVAGFFAPVIAAALEEATSTVGTP
ncbi:DUF1998 domain-containing protein [Streptomyces bugieae]|uniref:DUF1998 domain-containing protein n=1 Tax=Streptomyces bugieae TaxID=3098223 RepID=A0ABU7P031_9ACTN|nr:DUF1998 domain-containing protein [Streptomyces sp. DSM 41528]